jgi:hypothetical protein
LIFAHLEELVINELATKLLNAKPFSLKVNLMNILRLYYWIKSFRKITGDNSTKLRSVLLALFVFGS